MRREKNIFCVLEYRGENYYGFARQKNLATVEEKLSWAIGQIANHPVKLKVAGRTDRGVHASGQVVSFRARLPIIMSPEKFSRAASSLLPPDIRIIKTLFLKKPLDARAAALSRTYHYNVLNGPDSVFLRSYLFNVEKPLNLKAMRKAAAFLVGSNDFRFFQAAGSSFKTTIRRIFKIEIKVKKAIDFFWLFGKKMKAAKIFQFIIQADAFLYRMCRNIITVLLEVGLGRLNYKEIKKMLDSPKSLWKFKPVPARGLVLAQVKY